jgi:hypothetical protein
VALGNHCGCGFLLTLGGFHHLDSLERRGASAHLGDCSWPTSMIVRGLVPFLMESRKVTLVDCLCH